MTNASVYPTTSSISRMTRSSPSLSEQIAGNAIREARARGSAAGSSRVHHCSHLTTRPSDRAIQAFRLDQLAHRIGHEVAVGRPAATRSRSSMRRCRPAASRCGRRRRRRAHPARRRAPRDPDPRELGHQLGLMPGGEGRELVGAEQQDEDGCPDSAARARARCRPCTTGLGRSISTRETVTRPDAGSVRRRPGRSVSRASCSCRPGRHRTVRRRGVSGRCASLAQAAAIGIRR